MNRFNRWYDGIKEPWRMLFFLTIVLPAFWLLNDAHHQMRQILGAAYLLSLIFVRVRFLHRSDSAAL